MKKTLFALIPFLAIALTSCLKGDDPDPVTGKNSTLKIQYINVLGYVPSSSTPSITGYLKREFHVQNVDTPGAPLEVISYTDSFSITSLEGYNQDYFFDTPEKTKIFKASLSIKLKGANATLATVNNMTFKKDDNTYINTSLNLQPNATYDVFTAPTQTVNY
jgi:hypothetical protein